MIGRAIRGEKFGGTAEALILNVADNIVNLPNYRQASVYFNDFLTGRQLMPNEIAGAGLLLKMLKDAGYKNTSYAVAELVDNSIEAEAHEIGLFLMEKNFTSIRTVTLIDEIAIADDGLGMSPEVLGKCLSLVGAQDWGASGLGNLALD